MARKVEELSAKEEVPREFRGSQTKSMLATSHVHCMLLLYINLQKLSITNKLEDAIAPVKHLTPLQAQTMQYLCSLSVGTCHKVITVQWNLP